MYLSKDVIIYGYFSKSKGVQEKKSLGKTEVETSRRTSLHPFTVIFSHTAK